MPVLNEYKNIYEAMGEFLYQVIIDDVTVPKKDIMQAGGNFYPQNGNDDMIVMQLLPVANAPLSAVAEMSEPWYDEVDKIWRQSRTANYNRTMQIECWGDRAYEWGDDILTNCNTGIMSAWFLQYTPNMGIVGMNMYDPLPRELDQKLSVDRVVIKCVISVTSTKVINLPEFTGMEIETIAIM